jgi:membrane protease YdiL (CAAX protease family)
MVAIVSIVAWHLSQGGSPQDLQRELIDWITQPGMFIGLGLLGQLTMLGAALAAAWLSPEPLASRLGLVSPRLSTGKIAVLLVGTLVPFAVGIGAAYSLAEVIDPDPSVAAMYENLTLDWAIPFLLFISLAPGIAEELLFRGYAQRRLLARWSPWLAIGLTSVVFALFHVTPHAVSFAFPLGIWLGLIAWRTGSTWPGIACHALVNGLWNVWQLGVRFEFFAEEAPTWLLVLLGVIGSATFVASLWILFARSPAGLAEPTDIRASPLPPTL